MDFGPYGTFRLAFSSSADQAAIVAALTGGVDSAFYFDIYGASDPLPFSIGAKTFSWDDAIGEIAPGITLNLSGVDWLSVSDLASAQAAVFGEGNTSGTVTVGNSLVIQTGANAGDTPTSPSAI